MSEHSDQTAFSPITIATFDALCHAEPEIVKRINSTHNGARLFLINPMRLLSEVGVTLQPGVSEEWSRSAGGDLFTQNGLESTYDAVVKSRGASQASVRIRHLIKRQAK